MGNIVTKHSEESKGLGAVTVDMSDDIAPNQVTKPDIGEEQKRWLIVGLCLHDLVSPALRTYVRPIVEAEFKRFKEKNPAQQFSNYQKTYTPTKQKMNYTNINNNAQQLNDNGKPDWAKFDFHVKDYVDFSKLFLQTYMVHYTDFDNTCDQSALLTIIKKMHSFPKPIKTVTENLGTAVRNPWAHVDFKEWDTVKYQTCFELMTQVIKEMKQPDEREIIDQLTFWQFKGMQFLSGPKIGLELLHNVSEKTKALVIYIKGREKTSHDNFETCLKALDDILLSLISKLTELESRVDTHDAMLKQHSKEISDIKSAFNVNQPGQQVDAATVEVEDTRELADRLQKLPMEDKQLPHKPEISDKIDPENMETDGNYSNIQSTSSFISGEKVYDAVLLYAADDLEIAKKVLADLRTIPDEYKIDLFDDLPLANHTHFKAIEYAITSSRFILIVATEKFRLDFLVNYQCEMALLRSIECNQHQIVPIWLKQKPVNFPLQLSVLKGLKYDNTENFLENFKRLMQKANILA